MAAVRKREIVVGTPARFLLDVEGLIKAVDERIKEAWAVQSGDSDDFWAYTEFDVNFYDFLEEVK